MAVNTAPIERKYPGYIVGRVATYDDPESTQGRPDAPLEVLWSVNKYRKDYFDVVSAIDAPQSFSRYGQSLLDGCFKKWGLEQ